MITEQEFREEYLRQLKKQQMRERAQAEAHGRNPSGDYDWLIDADDARIERCADKMIAAVKRDLPLRRDWLGQNPIMRRAARELGITRSVELREAATSW